MKKLIHSLPAYLMTSHRLNSAILPKTGKMSVSAHVSVSSSAFSSSYASSSSGSGMVWRALRRERRNCLVDSGVYEEEGVH